MNEVSEWIFNSCYAVLRRGSSVLDGERRRLSKLQPQGMGSFGQGRANVFKVAKRKGFGRELVTVGSITPGSMVSTIMDRRRMRPVDLCLLANCNVFSLYGCLL